VHGTHDSNTLVLSDTVFAISGNAGLSLLEMMSLFYTVGWAKYPDCKNLLHKSQMFAVGRAGLSWISSVNKLRK